MGSYQLRRDADGDYVEVARRGAALLTHPMFNKGTAFTPEERETFKLGGLLPPGVSTLDQQVERASHSILRKTDSLERYIGLVALQDRNEVLFYRVMLEDLEQFLPIVYTPTVGLACQSYSHIFRKPRGLWITPADQGRIAETLDHAWHHDVRLIVVTDNERILGLGDQGAGGMGIPIGKLALYTVAAGIHPTHCLPISLDVGTDNQALRDDPLYLGWREPRLRGRAYHALVDEFVAAVQDRFPRALLQWEDFKKQNALDLLDRYRDRLCSFNDDIQGTAAVAVAAIMSACRASGRPLREQRVVIAGAGAAGIGIARQLRDAMQRGGLAGGDLQRAIAVLDSRGLVVEDGQQTSYKAEVAWPRALASASGLEGEGPHALQRVVEALQPSVLIGTTGQAGVFDEQVIRTLAAHCERPVVFPLSNPTSKAEATAADVVAWSGGRAIVAAGSPFAPVTHEGRTIQISQANNAYVFPGLGLGVLLAQASRVPDSLFTAAAEALAGQVTGEELAEGRLLPPVSELRRVSAAVAAAVVREAREAGIGKPFSDEEIPARVAEAMWDPVYPRYQVV